MMIIRLIPLLVLTLIKETLSYQPEFVESISNISVPVGRDATFKCQVKHLGGYRVGWLKADTKAIQAIHENVITHNSRVTVSHQDQSTWNLHIKAVTEEDRGGYMCQLNTDPMKSQIGFLDVVIPPDFVVDETSSDVIVAEGSSVKLTCRARGYPEPIVNWRREDGNEIVIKDTAGTKTLVTSYRGEVLKLTKIARNEMGSYLCIASNGVPPSISKRIALNIHFHPVIQVPNQLVGAPLGTDVQIECHVEASPKSINYWIKDSGEMIVSSTKYHVQEFSKSMYETKMSLSVRKFQKEDVGSYRCIAKNSLGEVDSSIRLYEIPGPNRKNPANKHGNENDANDILKMKQVKVTYQPDEEDLYGSAENYDDNDFALPPMPPNIYYTNGNKPPTNNPIANGGNMANVENTFNGNGKDGGRHHHNHHQNQHQRSHTIEFGNLGGSSNGIGTGSGFTTGIHNGNGVGTGGGFGNNANTRKPSFQSKTENRDAMDNNEKSSAGTKVSIWLCWWHMDSHYRHFIHLQFLIVFLVPSLISTFRWTLL